MVKKIVGYSAGQAAEAVGLTYRMVDHWARTGLVEPTVGADGTGTARSYSFGDLVALRAAKRLRDDGISLQSIRKVVGRIRKMTESKSPLSDRYLVASGNDIVELQGDKVMSWLKQPGQRMFAWILAVDAVREEVAGAVGGLHKPTRGAASKVG
jgi:DNA-binding transcriptional MerR regulator